MIFLLYVFIFILSLGENKNGLSGLSTSRFIISNDSLILPDNQSKIDHATTNLIPIAFSFL